MALPEMPHWGWLVAAGGMTTVIVAAWRQIVNVIKWLGDLVICSAIVKNDAADAVTAYAFENGKRSPFGHRLYGGAKTYVNPIKRVEVVGYESVAGSPLLFWFNKRPIIIARRTGTYSGNKSGGGVAAPGNFEKDKLLQLWFLRGTFDAEKFILAAINAYNELHRAGIEADVTEVNKRRPRFQVIRIGSRTAGVKGAGGDSGSLEAAVPGRSDSVDIEEGLKTKSLRLLAWQSVDIGLKSDGVSAFNGVSFPDSILDICNDVDRWLKNETWFRSKSIPWRMGFLLYGKTGSGKSTLVRSIAMEFNMPIIVVDLSGTDNTSLPSVWENAQQRAPSIILIEDIDSVFHGRKNVTTGNKMRETLTFDCLLNTISGVGNSDGILLFITTNDVSKLDSALGIPQAGTNVSTRPGRLDRVVELNVMEEPERRKLALFILGEFPELIEDTVALGEGETAAQFQHRCAQLALGRFWKK